MMTEASYLLFKTLMQNRAGLQNQQWSEAERYALQAQRLAPQAAETYLFLALTANHKQQYSNAESLARRGLSFAQSQAMKTALVGHFKSWATAQ